MINWDEEKETLNVVFEKDMNLYDSEEAGRTCQNLFVNGIEISVNEFKNSKKKEEKMSGISGRIRTGILPFYKGDN